MGKGRIVLVPFPLTDLSGQKIRPALILCVSRGEDCIVAFISSVKRKKSAFDVSVKATRANGLKVNSIIKTDKLATLQRKIVLGELGTLERASLVAVDTSLRKLFKL